MEALTTLLLVAGTFLFGLVARAALVLVLLAAVWVATVAVQAPVRGAGWLWRRAHAHAAA